MRAAIAIQHHPSRAELLPELLASLEPLHADVVADPEPDAAPVAWRAYRLALETTPVWATHRVVIQDDTEVCDRFAETLELVIAGAADRLLALCVCGTPLEGLAVSRARPGVRYADLKRRRYMPVIATVWPAAMIAPALAWIDRQNFPAGYADDEILNRWTLAAGVMPAATVPSIVEHPDRVPSVIGRRRPLAGRDRFRVAARFDRDAYELWRPSTKLDTASTIV